MVEKPYLWIVFMHFPSQLEARFNKWYDEVHVPLVTGGGHFSSLTRYCLTDAVQSNLTKYMAVCEFRDEETFRDWLVSEARAEAAADTAETWREQDVEFWPKGFYEPYMTYDLHGRAGK